MQPLFGVCSVPYGDKPSRGLSITCGRCGAVERKHINSVKGFRANQEPTEQLAARKFEEDGWKIGKTPGQHRCPGCVRESRAAQMRAVHAMRPKETEMTVVELKPDKASEPPREITRADRRVLFAKLEEAYGDDKYKPGWTDQKVAADLGVPVAWVRDVRDDNFGPVGTNPEIDKLLEEQRAWRSDIVKMLKVADEVNARFKALAAQGEAIERKVAEIEKQVGL